MKFSDFKNKDLSKFNISYDEIDDIEEMLKNTEQGEISNSKEAEIYISILFKYRETIEKFSEKNGKNFSKTLRNMLSVGENGVYSNKLRFIFELIQNVDDCSFLDLSDRKLEIKFNDNVGTIVLTYNETGFTPENVFNITGIAEAGKNISKGKNEIGEKGIGFKSVFGVAYKVLIQSGFFSFEIDESHFTVPIPKYENFEYVKGTKLTLYMNAKLVNELYAEIAKKYCEDDALLNKNPLLFLNKLTSLRFYIDSFRSLTFTVSRNEKVSTELFVEEDVKISVDLNDYNISRGEHSINKEISCYRYTMPIEFNHNMCVSRYGKDTAFESKSMLLQAVIPHVEHVNKKSRGSLYSFLPTQLKFAMPVVCHVPFKLDGSREFVDPENKNEWFRHCCSELSSFITNIYSDLCLKTKENIVKYLPKENTYYFVQDNEKANCLLQNIFKANNILEKPIFYTSNGNYNTIDNIVVLDNSLNIDNKKEVYSLLGIEKELFLFPEGYFSPPNYGFQVIDNIYEKLFYSALKNEKFTYKALDVLKDIDNFDYLKIIESSDNEKTLTFTNSQIQSFMKFEKVSKTFNEYAIKKLRKNMRPQYRVSYENAQVFNALNIMPDNPIEKSDLDEVSKAYLSLISFKTIQLDLNNANSFFVANNVLILSKKSPQRAFIDFCKRLDDNGIFTANLTFKQASRELNDVDNTISPKEYLKMIKGVRKTIKTALGYDGYRNYINLINNAGTDSNRFINELLQNADDCLYDKNIDTIPTFCIDIHQNKLTAQYNENGFKKENVRAITAIGESTKKKLCSLSLNEVIKESEIGEKGIGFKSVFSIARNVEIHSNGFDFKLTDTSPTIPEIIDAEKNATAGTKMILHLKENFNKYFFNEEKVLLLCLCLRKLKHIVLSDFDVEISDTETERNILINKKEYRFKKIKYDFIDKSCLTNEKNQTITCYIPLNKNKKKNQYPVYNGLPTKTMCNVPIAIDAPFELTTSRDQILDNDSNKKIKGKMYLAIIKVMQEMKDVAEIDILSFINITSKGNQHGMQYELNMFNDAKLNETDFLTLLKYEKIILDINGKYLAPADRRLTKVPDFIYLLLKDNNIEFNGNCPVNDKTNKYETILNCYGVEEMSLSKLIPILREFIGSAIQNETFRKSLYGYLKNIVDKDINDYRQNIAQIKNLKIIPIKTYGTPNVRYVAYSDNIFVKKEAAGSTTNYYYLKTEFLSKQDCEKIFDVSINEMNQQYEETLYRANLEKLIKKSSNSILYKYLTEEYDNNRIMLDSCRDTLIVHAKNGEIPFKNENNIIDKKRFFISLQERDYFKGPIVSEKLVHEDCKEFAKWLELNIVEKSDFETLGIEQRLTADDIETFQDDSFIHRDQILQACIENNLISEELMNKYNLWGLQKNKAVDEKDYDFPNNPVRNFSKIKQSILDCGVSKIVTEKRTYDKFLVKDPNGFETDLNTAKNEARKAILEMYSPDNDKSLCFCQMCKKVKMHKFIEINSIELSPEEYWPQTRVALCLECSKTFEELRKNEKIRDDFKNKIKEANVNDNEPIEIPIGMESLTFIQTHLAEIQEIFKKEGV